jgi:hypothetical protein
MGTLRNIVVGAAGLVVTGVGTWNTLDTLFPSAQPAGTPSQPGTPSKQPRPQNPQPRPQNPQPDPQNPQPDPNSPGERIPDPERRDGDRPTDANRYMRPFAFDNPALEGRFNLATRRLVQMEARFQRSQEDLLRRLGEARQLSGPRQTDALFDVVQQMLRDQAELHRYLTQARTAWSGDIELDPTDSNDGVDPPAIPPQDRPADRR